MKIGILTLKYANNYGGILQSLALQEYLKQLNHDVEIINFKSTLHETIYHRIIYAFFNLIFSHNIISILRDKLNEHKQQTSPDPTNLINKIESFMHKYLNRGELVNENNIEDYCKKFDCIIVGSDQVWSVSNASKLIYFIDWEYEGKRIAFSTCSVNKQPALLNKRKIKHLLLKFDLISVRDEFTQNFVYNTSKQKPIITVDPTFLIDFESVMPLKRIIHEPYILLYILGNEIRGGNKQAINIIKNIYGDIKVISIIIPSVSIVGKNGADEILTECTPNEWLCLIKYADFVYTDSFHGCVFSIKYNKDFIGYYNYAKRATRLIDLAKRYELHNIVSDVSQIRDALKFAHEKNKHKISNSIQESIKYLKSI